MGKNIKIYSLIIAMIYCLVIIQYVYEAAAGAKTGFEMGMNDARNYQHTDLFHFKVEPNNGQLTFPEMIVNTLTGEKMIAEAGEYKVKIAIPFGDRPVSLVVFDIIKTASAFFMLAILIYIPFLFFSIIKLVNKGGILEPKTIKKISRIGWLLLIIFIFNTLIYDIFDPIMASKVIQIEGYKIIPNLSNLSSLFLSIIVLFLGEILKHTAKLKEEQDLTI